MDMEELKNKFEAAETLEEKKAILEAEGYELTDEDLEDVSAGIAKLPWTIITLPGLVHEPKIPVA